jgi:hypothetical protein
MDYSSNNGRTNVEPTTSATEQKKRAPIVTGGTSVKKKSELSKFASNFISDEASNLKRRIVQDIVVPTIRDTIWTAVTTVFETLLYGGGKGPGRSGTSYAGPYSAPYINYSTKKTSGGHQTEPQARNSLDFDHIVFRTPDDAHNVLDCLKDDIRDYGMAYVSSVYDLCNRANDAPYTANRYGWRSLDKAEVLRLRGGGGYIIKFPRAMLVD